MGGARRPRGYEGLGHETVGSDLLAVLQSLTAPEAVLGAELHGRLLGATPDGWYPIAWMLEINEALDLRVGKNGLRQMGRQLFRDTHAENVKRHIKSAHALLYGLDTLYHAANRGEQIGGWSVVEFRPGFARLEKTTPHHCVMEEGILAEALATIGVPALVQQRGCFRAGGDLCVYEVSAPVFGPDWTGKQP